MRARSSFLVILRSGATKNLSLSDEYSVPKLRFFASLRMTSGSRIARRGQDGKWGQDDKGK